MLPLEAAANYRCEAAGRSFAARFEVGPGRGSGAAQHKPRVLSAAEATGPQESPSESDQDQAEEIGEEYTTGKGPKEDWARCAAAAFPTARAEKRTVARCEDKSSGGYLKIRDLTAA